MARTKKSNVGAAVATGMLDNGITVCYMDYDLKQ